MQKGPGSETTICLDERDSKAGMQAQQKTSFLVYLGIETGKILKGRFPKKQEKLVQAWADIYKKTLMENWNSLTNGKGFRKIENV